MVVALNVGLRISIGFGPGSNGLATELDKPTKTDAEIIGCILPNQGHSLKKVTSDYASATHSSMRPDEVFGSNSSP